MSPSRAFLPFFAQKGMRSVCECDETKPMAFFDQSLVFKVSLDKQILKNNSISWKFVTLWHANTHNTIALLLGHTKPVRCIAYNGMLYRSNTIKYKSQFCHCAHSLCIFMHMYINSRWNNRIRLNMQLLSHKFIYIAHYAYTSSPASFSCCKSLNRTLNSCAQTTDGYNEKCSVAAAFKGKLVSALFLSRWCKNHQMKIVIPGETKMNRIISNKTHFELIRMSWSWIEREKKRHRIGMRIFCKCGSKSIYSEVTTCVSGWVVEQRNSLRTSP